MGFFYLSGCTTLTATPHPFSQLSKPAQTRVQTRNAQLNKQTGFTLKGAVAIQLPKEQLSLFANWQQQDRQRYHITFIGPGGMGSLALYTTKEGIVLKRSDGQIQTANSAEALLKHYYAWHLPIQSLYFWIRGLAAPDIIAIADYAKDGTLSHLAQAGWRIDYLDFTTVNGRLLPKKLVLKNTTYKLRVKIIISNWQL